MTRYGGAECTPEVRQSRAYEEGWEILRRYCARENANPRIPAYTEHKIAVPFGPYTLVGCVDRLDFTENGGYSLLDYKLDRQLPRHNEAERSLQLSFYHLLVYEALGVSPEDVRLYYLRHGVEQVSSRSREEMRATIDWIEDTAAGIRDERKWTPCEGEACRTCPFWAYCPAKTGTSRENRPVWRQTALDLENDTVSLRNS